MVAGINPFSNNKHRVIKKFRSQKLCNQKLIFKVTYHILSLPIYCMYYTDLYNEMVSRGIHCNGFQIKIILFISYVHIRVLLNRITEKMVIVNT